MSKRATLFFVGLFMAVSVLAQVWAYEVGESHGKTLKWDSNTVRMRASGVSFPTGDNFTNVLTRAIDRWNEAPSNFSFNLTFNDPGVGLDNGQNETWFTNDPAVLGGAPAVTWPETESYWFFGWRVKIVEEDIVFDTTPGGNTWTSGTAKGVTYGYGGNQRPFLSAALHELGHALGLEHENQVYNIMGEDWTHTHTNWNSTISYPGEDASTGAVYLYGLNSNRPQDVAASHWKWTGTNDEYSTHGRTGIFDATRAAYATLPGAAEPTYRVDSGGAVLLELTYENNGVSTQNVDLGFYLSTDDNISGGDLLRRTITRSLVRDTPDTMMDSVILPSDLTEGGDYYVGAIVDSTNQIVERNEWNNATYVGIRILPVWPMVLSFTPPVVDTPGDSATGTVTLNGRAGAGGVVLSLTSSTAYVMVPPSVTVPPGATSASFPVTTAAGQYPIRATITATRAARSVSANLIVNPLTIAGSEAVWVEQFDRIFECLNLSGDPRKPVKGKCGDPGTRPERLVTLAGRVVAIPEHLPDIYKDVLTFLTADPPGQVPQPVLARLVNVLDRAPRGRYYDDAVHDSVLAILREFGNTRKHSRAVSGALVAAVNALELDVRVPSLKKQPVIRGDVELDFQNVARMTLQNVKEPGEASLSVLSGLPVPTGSLRPGWPVVSYVFDFKGTGSPAGGIDISFNTRGLNFSGQPANLRVYEWNGKRYRDVTTSLDLPNNQISARTYGFKATLTILNLK